MSAPVAISISAHERAAPRRRHRRARRHHHGRGRHLMSRAPSMYIGARARRRRRRRPARARARDYMLPTTAALVIVPFGGNGSNRRNNAEIKNRRCFSDTRISVNPILAKVTVGVEPPLVCYKRA